MNLSISKAFKVFTVPAALSLTGDYAFESEIFCYLCLKRLKVKVGPQCHEEQQVGWGVWRLLKAGTFWDKVPSVLCLLFLSGSSPGPGTSPNLGLSVLMSLSVPECP